MERVLVMQYRRGSKKLQVVILPWSGKYSIAALIRIWDQHTADAVHGWRFFPASGTSITLALGEEERFVVDTGAEEILQSAWVTNGAALELREFFELDAAEVTDLKMDRLPKSILSRISESVDNWA